MPFNLNFQAERIYILNYQELDAIEKKFNHRKSKRYVVAPMCLLYSRSNGDLMPIAIQLHQVNLFWIFFK